MVKTYVVPNKEAMTMIKKGVFVGNLVEFSTTNGVTTVKDHIGDE